MRLGLLTLLLTLLLAPLAQAGPWLRKKGASFSSTSFTINYFRETGSTVFHEYGARDDLTIGLDFGSFTNRFGSLAGNATAFMRRPLGRNEGTNRWAYEMGAGIAWVGDQFSPHVKAGLLWGRGIQINDYSGWMNIDTALFWDFRTAQHVAKLDTTIGINFTEVTTGMMQLYLAQINGDIYGTFAPSIVLKPKKGKFRYQIGVESPISDFDSTSLKLSLWHEF